MTLTVEETARLLGVSRGTAYEAARTGAIPTVRILNRILVPRCQLEKLLDGDRDANDRGHVSVDQTPAAENEGKHD